VGIRIEGGSDCLIDNCAFDGPATAVEIEKGDRVQVSRSKFGRGTKTAIRVRGGTGHRFIDNFFGGKLPPQEEGLAIIRQALSLGDRIPDREILASLNAVLDEREDDGKRKAARSSTLGKWLIEHGSDINTAVNTLVILAAAVAGWFK
jgi:hypothetical protein